MKRLYLYAAMTVAAITAALSVNLPAFGQAPSSLVNRVPMPGITDKNGATQVNTVGVNNTYTATAYGVVPASPATDVACLGGSATKNVLISSVFVSGTDPLTVSFPIQVTKHVALDVQGTAVTGAAIPVAYPYWSTNTAATAVPTAYTANPTISDPTPGVIAVAVVTFPTTTAVVNGSLTRFDFGARGASGQPTLIGAAQQLCVNFQSATEALSPTVSIGFEWTED